MSKANQSGNKKCKEDCCSKDPDSFVFLLKGCDSSYEVLKLKHPGNGKPTYFAFSADNSQLFELNSFKDTYRSFFINNCVQSDGTLHLISPVDRLFLILPFLKEASRCSPIDQVVKDDNFPEVHKLIENFNFQRLNLVADQKGCETLNAFKYNEEKTLEWLKKKVLKVVDALKENSINVEANNTMSANFVRGDCNISDDSYLAYAFGLVCEYLGEELRQSLRKHLNIPNETNASKRKKSESDSSNKENTKKYKPEDIKEDLPSPVIKPKTPTVTAKEKARAKAAVGSKSISSFFKQSTKTSP